MDDENDSNISGTTEISTMDLQLNHSDDPSPEDDLRRILPYDDHTWIAWGGETGALSLIAKKAEDTTTATVTPIHRHWDEDDDVRAVAVHHAKKNHQCSLAIGFESGAVLVYRDWSPTCTTMDSTNIIHGPLQEASIRDLVFLDTNTLLIASEAGWCGWDMDANTTFLSDTVAEHHNRNGIRSFTKSGTTLVSLDFQGFTCWWNVTTRSFVRKESSKCVTQPDRGEQLGADPWDRACRVTLAGNVAILPGEAWVQVRSIKDGTAHDAVEQAGYHTQAIVASAVRGQGLVTIGRDKRVVLWRLQKFKVTFIRQIAELESAATDLLWDTKDGTLRLACANGKLMTIPSVEVVEKSTAGDSSSVPVVATEPGSEPATEPGSTTKPKVADADGEDSESGEVTSPRTAAGIPADVDSDDDIFQDDKAAPAHKVAQYIDDEADDDDSDDGIPLPAGGPTLPGVDAAGRDPTPHNVVDEDGIPMNENDDDGLSIDSQSPHDGPSFYPTTTAAAAPLPDRQDAFAPSSTPLDLDRRFLCWNHLGSMVRRQDTAAALASVDIHFTDVALRRPITMTDTMGFILGAMGDDGAILCTDVADTEENEDDVDVLHLSDSVRRAVSRKKTAAGSSVYFHRFDTFASLRDKDWSLTLPSGERALGCATGEGWAAVMTSRRFLRTFTSGGNQGNVLWLEGDPVTMTGRGRFVACVYHAGEPLRDGSQAMGYMVLDVLSQVMVAKGALSCLSPAASLTWLGFSNDTSLMAMDSDGMLSMLVHQQQGNWEWMPMLDTCGLRKSTDDSFWPLAVFQGKLICVPLKGGSKYPFAERKPITTTLGFRVPLARGLLAKTLALEDVFLRGTIALGQKRAIEAIVEGTGEENDELDAEYQTLSAQLDKITLKMFAATIEAGKLERALDLVHRLNLEKSFELAMRISDHHRKLVDLIEEAMNEKFGGDEVEVDEYPATTSAAMPRISPDPPKRRHEDVMMSRNVRAHT